ncbi:HNH endonuclease [bacterium]|nr:HNH endonuclease [bacterium]
MCAPCELPDYFLLPRSPLLPEASKLEGDWKRTTKLLRPHRCQARGCLSTSFSEVHHLSPRILGGDNPQENLITLCMNCHLHLHEREWSLSGKEKFDPGLGDIAS